MTLRHLIFIALSLMALNATQAADDPVARLRSARSLRCTLTYNYVTVFIDGKRSAEAEQRRYEFNYDNIDVAKGTARGIFPDRAVDVSAYWHASSLFLVDRFYNGVVTTTIFPEYAVGTRDFIIVESRHFLLALKTRVVGGQAYGSCAVVE